LLKPNQHAVVTRLRFKGDAIRYLTSLGYSIDTTSRLVDIHITNGCRVLREGYNPGRPNDNYAAKIQRQFTDKKKRK